MKKIWLLSPFIFSLLASPLFGDQQSESVIAKGALLNRNQQGLRCSENNNRTSCGSAQINYRLPSDFNGTNTFAEYLIWQMQEQASYFALTPNDDSAVDPLYPNVGGLGTFRSAPFKWGSGIRVGIGYTMQRDHWQALGQYTWFGTEAKKSYSISPSTPTTTEFLMPTSYVQSTTPIVLASTNAHFSYQMADLLAARNFLATDQVRFNFFFGGSGGYIKEQFHITYRGTPGNTYHQNDWSFGGGGFRAGIDTNWHIGYGFGVCGRASFAAVLGQYTNTSRITADSPVVIPFPGASHITDTTYQGILLVPMTQIALGFDWCKVFVNCRVTAVKAAITAEFNNLSNLHQVFKSPDDFSTGGAPTLRDISSVYMYGANLRVGVDY